MNRIGFAALTVALLAAPTLTFGADLGKSATLAEIVAMKPASPLRGCYGDLSAAGTFLAAGDRIATAAGGVGCTAQIAGVLIVGAGARIDLGSAVPAGAGYLRAGVAINPNLALYGLAEWRVPDFKIANTGALYLGGGVETTVLSDSVSLFTEATQSVSKWGTATKDDLTIRTGLRWWIK